MKIVHIILDEKFPDSAYELFEAVAKNSNVFVLPNKKQPIKNLKKVKPRRVSRFAFLNPLFVSWINSFDALVLHGLKSFDLELIGKCRSDLKIYWIGMGFDYYDLIFDSPLDMLKDQTACEFIRFSNSQDTIKSKAFRFAKRLLKKLVYPKSYDKKSAIVRINYFCPVLESEFYRIKDNIPNFGAKYIDWNYGASSDLVDGKVKLYENVGKNILVGNSATPTNNHLEVFSLLKRYESYLDSRSKIIVPLSYGDDSYKEFVLSKGREFFGEKFFPIDKMLSVDDYLEIVSSCGFVFMNHIRQQAGNNIASGLYMGCRVFLDPRNPFYLDYKEKGCVLNSISEIDDDPMLLSRPISIKERESNKRLLRSIRGRESGIIKTKKLVETI